VDEADAQRTVLIDAARTLMSDPRRARSDREIETLKQKWLLGTSSTEGR